MVLGKSLFLHISLNAYLTTDHVVSQEIFGCIRFSIGSRLVIFVLVMEIIYYCRLNVMSLKVQAEKLH